MADKYRRPREDEIVQGFIFERGEVIRRSPIMFFGQGKEVPPDDEFEYGLEWRESIIYNPNSEPFMPTEEEQIKNAKEALKYNLVRVKVIPNRIKEK